MSEYTNDLYMQMYRSNQYTMFAVTAGVRAIMALAQFLARLQRENILSGGEVENYFLFIKATDGKYDMYNIPLTVQEDKEAQLDAIRGRLEKAHIRYHILPDLNEANNSVQICVFKDDLQRFSQVYADYIQENLSGGIKDPDDLRNFTNGRTSIVSMPDEAFESIKGAMENLRVDYAPLPDLNLKDGEKQFVISNSSVQSMKQAYQLYREGLIKQGKEVSEMRVMKSPQEYTDIARMSSADYIDAANSRAKEAVEKYNGEPFTDNELTINELENEIKPVDSPESSLFFNNDNYCKLSVDAMTLVDNPGDPLPSEMSEKFPDRFFCRIPGTYGEKEQILSVQKSHVFSVKNGGRPGYLVFVEKDQKPLVMTAGDKEGTRELYKSGEELYQYFDRDGRKAAEKEKSMVVGFDPSKAKSKFHNFEERDYDWNAIEKALLKSNKLDTAEIVTEKVVPIPPKVK